MPLVKGFLQVKFNGEIPKYKYFVGIIVGLLMAFFLYAFQYMTRELMRVSSASEVNIWILSDAEVNFYNLIFAFIAIIVGQSFCLEYWFNQPRNFLRSKPGRLQNIVHEQRFLNWYFLAWFFRAATMYGLTFCTVGIADFYIMSLYPNFNYMFVLMVIVLFLQPWNGLILTFRRKGFKWMGVSVVFVSILSLGLSKIDVVDYKILDNRIINNRLDVKYNLRIPTSKQYEGGDEERHFGYRFMRLPSVSIVLHKDSSRTSPLVFKGQRELIRSEFLSELLEMKRKQAMDYQGFMPVFLRIDKMVSMSYVREVKRDIYYSGLPNVSYSVIPSDAQHNPRYYEGRRRTFLTQYILDEYLSDYKDYRKISNTRANKIDIFIFKYGYKMGGKVISAEDLSTVLKEKLLEDHDYAFVLNFEDDISFDIYFRLISSIHEVIFALRNEYALKEYETDFQSILYDYDFEGDRRAIQMEITEKYPMRYIEVWDNSGIELAIPNPPYPPLPRLDSR